MATIRNPQQVDLEPREDARIVPCLETNTTDAERIDDPHWGARGKESHHANLACGVANPLPFSGRREPVDALGFSRNWWMPKSVRSSAPYRT
jgi:hypothetical protein